MMTMKMLMMTEYKHVVCTSESGCAQTRGLSRLRCDASTSAMTRDQCTYVNLFFTFNSFTHSSSSSTELSDLLICSVIYNISCLFVNS